MFQTEDHGQWTCQLTDPEHLGTDKSTINIEVAVPAKVHFDPGYGELDILRITEGETTKVNKWRFFESVCTLGILGLIHCYGKKYSVE